MHCTSETGASVTHLAFLEHLAYVKDLCTAHADFGTTFTSSRPFYLPLLCCSDSRNIASNVSCLGVAKHAEASTPGCATCQSRHHRDAQP